MRNFQALAGLEQVYVKIEKIRVISRHKDKKDDIHLRVTSVKQTLLGMVHVTVKFQYFFLY